MSTINHCFVESLERPKNQLALKYKFKRKWQSINWSKYFELSSVLAKTMHSFDVQKNDSIAIMSSTRFEWTVADRAIMGLGAITVPIYSNNSEDDIEFILNNCEAKVLFCENTQLLKKWKSIQDQCPHVKKIILIEGGNIDTKNTIEWSEVFSTQTEDTESLVQWFKEENKKATPEDTATIIYTSGTTGRPKGVVLTHRQIMSEVSDVFTTMTVNHKDSTLTFLPYAHVLGRVESWGSIYSGFTLCFAESIERIKNNIIELKPTFIIGVPRIFEKIYNSIISQAEAQPIKKRLFQWALDIGKSVNKYKSQGTPLPAYLLAKHVTAKRLVFDKVHEKLGGKLRFAVSGGAPLSKEIGEFFHACGLLILEGYGLTETTAGISFNTTYSNKFGTVGKPLQDVEIKIANDGEILVKSDKVLKEYYKNPEANKKAFVNGYFATGDIGKVDEEGFLKITDRKKDLIKTAGGKYIAPQRIENILKLNPYISNVHVHGDKKKFIVALLTLDEVAIKQFARDSQISFSDFSQLTKAPQITEIIKKAVSEANSQLASFESVKKYAVLETDFTVESGELTPSLKVKRKFCDEKFGHIISNLYGADKSSF